MKAVLKWSFSDLKLYTYLLEKVNYIIIFDVDILKRKGGVVNA
jgi:hypothetical protein